MSEAGTRWPGVALVAATVLTLAGLWALRAAMSGGGGAGWSMPPESVGMVVAAEQPWRSSHRVLATLAPEATLDVRTEVGGRLAEVGFVSGQEVAQGTVLARIDASLEEAELRGAEAEVAVLRLRRDRTAQLAAERGVSTMEVDQAEADVRLAESRADALRSRIRQKLLVAPFAGRTGIRHHHPGQVVDPGVRLTTLVKRSDDVFVDAWLPQTLVASLPVGSVLEVRLDDRVATAEVEVVEPAADPARRSVQVRARVSPAPEGWLPGMSVQVEVPAGDEVLRVVIPSTAIVWSPVGALVYRVVPTEGGGQVVTANPVEVYERQGDDVVLASGLAAGAQIATDGAFKLHEGAVVQAAGEPL